MKFKDCIKKLMMMKVKTSLNYKAVLVNLASLAMI